MQTSPAEQEEMFMEYARSEREELFMEIKGGKGYTTADIEALPEGERAELIDGQMFQMDAPMRIHQNILLELAIEIKTYIRKNKGTCKIYVAPFGVRIKKDNRNYVEPDISVICDMEKLDERGCFGAPDWVIEIVSPTSVKMDYERKTALYREAGVREYWIVDPDQQRSRCMILRMTQRQHDILFQSPLRLEFMRIFICIFRRWILSNHKKSKYSLFLRRGKSLTPPASSYHLC